MERLGWTCRLCHSHPNQHVSWCLCLIIVLMIAMIRWGGTVGRTIQSQQMKAKDGRILLMNEILQVLDKLIMTGQTGLDN